MVYSDLLNDVEEHVSKLFIQNNLAGLCYHNFEHTKNVVGRAYEIIGHYSLDEVQQFVVLTAAWFHDAGHLLGYLKDHEEAGVRLMQDYFTGRLPVVETSIQDEIASCIMATKVPPHPSDILHKIICDADTYHLGTAEFRTTDPMVKKEMEMRTGKQFPAWDASTLQLLKEHRFYTDYCKKLLGNGKKENIMFVENKVNQAT
jgi:hypothetical protein